MKRKRIWIAAVAILLVWIGVGFYNALAVRRYSVDAGLGARVRLCLITDLHSCRYGERAETLIRAIVREKPDLILLGGDILDDSLPDDNTEYLLMGIADKYPCYYVTGNHEYWSGNAFEGKMELLARYGVRRLAGETVTAETHGAKFNLCGVDDPYSGEDMATQLSRTRGAAENGLYTVLLSHRPERIGEYAEYGFDLVLCGHAHGGQWRIPGALNGLYAPNQGFFPRYAGGRYEASGTTMIVSRGLARESTRVPRFYNRPELVIVDLE